MVHAVLKAVRVVNGNSGNRHHARPRAISRCYFVHGAVSICSAKFQLLRTIGNLGRFTEAGQINGKAGEAVTQPVDNAAPEAAAGGHPVYEQDWIT